jgi:hypothetical protein
VLTLWRRAPAGPSRKKATMSCTVTERSNDRRPDCQTNLVVQHPSGETEGCDPRDLSPATLAKVGHHLRPILKVIRDKCLDCCAGQSGEVRRCTAVRCPLWPYRMGANPFAKPRGLSQPVRSDRPGKTPLFAANFAGAGLSSDHPPASGGHR